VFTVNSTFGSFDHTTTVWNQSRALSLKMLECPDLFQLGGSWVLLGSMARVGGPNQWWTGTLTGTPPRFTPEKVGLLDFGSLYAAKSGSTFLQGRDSRRVVFGFTGWSEPTAAAGCGRYLVMPRELTVRASGLHIDPIPEMKRLRVAGSETHGVIDGLVGGVFDGMVGSETALVLATGAQIEVDVTCTCTSPWPSHGQVVLRTLGSVDGEYRTEVGWDFGSGGTPFFVDHTRCCQNTSSIVQRALAAMPPPGEKLTLRVFVDSGMIEAFAAGVVITALVNPDIAGGLPEERVSSVTNTAAGVSCAVSSYQLQY
jgi:sucrose-6-phosphate hydrolase SacC (GH32 family)